MGEEHNHRRPADRNPVEHARMTDSEHAALEAFAAADLNLAEDRPETFFDEAAVLKGNAMGIIHSGDGSSNAEKVQRLLMLVPALLTVVDEARDTISRLRDIEDRLKPSAGRSFRVLESGPNNAGQEGSNRNAAVSPHEEPPTRNREQNLYIRAAVSDIERTIVSGVPGCEGPDPSCSVAWSVTAVDDSVSVVSWRDPGDGSSPAAAPGDWHFRLSAVKTWLETATPLVEMPRHADLRNSLGNSP
ncbi:hypothetical protein [Homoserinimonas sp. OAct 916]|uniref:hypothetical protein n=1 Tax=Homoserinimonas sp. OAct 916 TaxID=2211450 RepID=UPI000DBE7BCD|nr:hypothetical protein [Homoserinimonas sp. OAct 916]